MFLNEFIRKEQAVAQVAKTASHKGTFQSAEGLRIFFRSWQPESQLHATVAIVPGFNSHRGYYIWAAEQLMSAGVAVFAVDLRGADD